MTTESVDKEVAFGSSDGRLRRMRPRDFRTVPKLDSPAAYICVLRDPNASAYRIEATDDPNALIDKLLQEGDFQFGMELVALVATDDLAASEAYLDDKHGAALSSQWLNFDEHQIATLNHSVLVAQARNGFYIFPEDHSAANRPLKTRRNVERYWSGYERRRWNRSSEWDSDPVLDEEDGILPAFLTSKRVEIGFKIALVIIAVLITLAKNS